MANDVDVLLEMSKEHWEEMRHVEGQRSTFTNIILIIASILIGVLAQQPPSQNLLLISFFLVLLGIYGMITTAKLYERHQSLQNRLNHWYKRIDELTPNAKFIELRDLADNEHKAQKWLIQKFRLHYLWMALHAFITLAGIGVAIYILFKI